jgi:hypothetical protein
MGWYEGEVAGVLRQRPGRAAEAEGDSGRLITVICSAHSTLT